MTSTISETPRPRSTAPLLTLGLCLPALGVLGYVVQLQMQHLWAPWYMPIAATIGVVLVAISMWKKPGVLRGLALLAVFSLSAAEWGLTVGLRLPAYTGPVAAGSPFPAFATTRADGSPFTHNDLQNGQDHVLVFFRGRW